jgi:hypothetical protein
MRRRQQQRIAVVFQQKAGKLKSVVIVFFSGSQKKKPTPRAWVVPISSCFASIGSEAKSSPESHGRRGHHVAALATETTGGDCETMHGDKVTGAPFSVKHQVLSR